MTERMFSADEARQMMQQAAGAGAGAVMVHAPHVVMPSEEILERVDRIFEEFARPGAAVLVEEAWGIIANAHSGDWTTAEDAWRQAAVRWRDRFHRWLDAQDFGSAQDCGPAAEAPVDGMFTGPGELSREDRLERRLWDEQAARHEVERDELGYKQEMERAQLEGVIGRG